VHKRRNKIPNFIGPGDKSKKGGKTRNKNLESPLASDKGGQTTSLKGGEEASSSASPVAETKSRKMFVPYGSVYDLGALISVANVFGAYCESVHINEILDLDNAPKGRMYAVFRYAGQFGFRAQGNNKLLQQFNALQNRTREASYA
jgi:hypothetical protein